MNSGGFYEQRIPFLHDFNERLRQLVCRLIGIETPVSYTTRYIECPNENQQPSGEGTFQENGKLERKRQTKGSKQQEQKGQAEQSEQPDQSDQTDERIIDLREAIHPKRPSCLTTPPITRFLARDWGSFLT